MIIGVIISNDKHDKSKSIVSFCASKDDLITEYYNRIIL